MLDQFPFAQKVFQTIFSILPRTLNLLMILAITLFIYSVVGMELFCFLKHNNEIDGFNQNYESFTNALLALIKFSTMESPIEQIKDTSQTFQPNFVCFQITEYEQFQTYGQNGCGHPLLSFLFFGSFHFLFSMFLFPTLIALIVDAYSDIKKDENSIVNKSIISKLVEEWKEVDEEGKGYIPYSSFWQFYLGFLKIHKGKDRLNFGSKQKVLEKLNLTVYELEGEYCFRFHEAIENLVKMYLEAQLSESIVENEVHRNFEKIYTKDHCELGRTSIKSGEVGEFVLARQLLNRWHRQSQS